MVSADYISREAALRANCYFCSAHLKDDLPCGEKCADYMKFMEIPAADVWPVVFCGECKCYEGRERAGYTEGFCKRSDLCVGAFDFCSRGEKREES